MATSDPSRPEAGKYGIHCLYCGQWQNPPHADIDTWTCNYCYSGFVTFRMLINLIPRDVVEDMLRNPSQREKDRPCPQCRRPLSKVEVTRHEATVALEICRSCQFAWLEGGAIVKLARIFGTKPVAHVEPPRRGLTAPKKNPQQEKEEPRFAPWTAMGFFLLAWAASFLSANHPEWVTNFGFLTSSPFRGLGLTFISSLVLNDREQLKWLLLFLAGGVYAERRLGANRFISLCLTAGVAARLADEVSQSGGPSALIIGTTPCLLAALAFGVAEFPMREYLFPKEKWKSPMEAISWGAIGLGLFVLVFVLLDLLNQVMSGSFTFEELKFNFPLIGEWHLSIFRWSHLVALAAGVFWSISRPKIQASDT